MDKGDITLTITQTVKTMASLEVLDTEVEDEDIVLFWAEASGDSRDGLGKTGGGNNNPKYSTGTSKFHR